MNFRISPPACETAEPGAEIVVKQADHRIARQAVGGAREAAQIAVPDHRFDRLAFATLHLAGQDAQSGGPAHIGIEEVRRDIAEGVVLHHARERKMQVIKPVEFLLRKSARTVRNQAERIDMPVREKERQGDIVCRALRLELAENRRPGG
jgi:hypothetical protein